MPKSLISDIDQGTVELENEILDTADLEQSYDEGVDEEENKNEDQFSPDAGAPQQQQGMAPGGMPPQQQQPNMGGM
jgi:hypothetical protein